MKRLFNISLLLILLGLGTTSCFSDSELDEIVVEQDIQDSESDTDGTDGNSSGQTPPPEIG